MRNWLITGGSKGLGRAFAEVALGHGDRVALTARDQRSVEDLAALHPGKVIPIGLDVTDRAAVVDAVGSVRTEWGTIDVLVNNAGYGLAGAVEEVTEEQAREQMEVNFFGALWGTQAVLPVMRRQKSGHIFQISSVGGVAALPNAGLYCASKFALEGLSESLAAEVKPFGINVTLVELGPFRTDWNGDSMDRAEPNPVYDEILAERREVLSGAYARTQPGDPHKAGQALIEVLEAEQPPLRLLLGKYAADRGPAVMATRLEEWAEWDSLARGADFDDEE
jgi:NAD(P)-dependent dehydrogenase (short-subunit alcohol dehydrogenase family)